MKREIIFDIIFYLLVLLFLYTGVNKIIAHDIFEQALRKSPYFYKIAAVLSWIVPIGELAIVAALFIPRTRRLGLIVYFITMVTFTVYVGYMLYIKSDRPCTCGGIIQQMNWHQHFYFNTVFSFLALLGILLDNKINQVESNNIKPISYSN